MDKYKKITDLGLEVYDNSKTWIPQSFVRADDLLKVLDAGVEVTGDYDESFAFFEKSNPKLHGHTHSGLVINIKPLAPKQVTITREDLIEAVKNTNSFSGSYAEKLAEKLGL